MATYDLSPAPFVGLQQLWTIDPVAEQVDDLAGDAAVRAGASLGSTRRPDGRPAQRGPRDRARAEHQIDLRNTRPNGWSGRPSATSSPEMPS